MIAWQSKCDTLQKTKNLGQGPDKLRVNHMQESSIATDVESLQNQLLLRKSHTDAQGTVGASGIANIRWLHNNHAGTDRVKHMSCMIRQKLAECVGKSHVHPRW